MWTETRTRAQTNTLTVKPNGESGPQFNVTIEINGETQLRITLNYAEAHSLASRLVQAIADPNPKDTE